MRQVVLFVLIFVADSSLAQKKQVCFSFDDLPVVSYGITDPIYQQQLTDRLVASQGKKGDFFKDKPITPDYIKTMAE